MVLLASKLGQLYPPGSAVPADFVARVIKIYRRFSLEIPPGIGFLREGEAILCARKLRKLCVALREKSAVHGPECPI